MPASMYFTSFADDFINDDTIMQSASPNTHLDELCLVDQQLLYLCCPYLGKKHPLSTMECQCQKCMFLINWVCSFVSFVFLSSMVALPVGLNSLHR